LPHPAPIQPPSAPRIAVPPAPSARIAPVQPNRAAPAPTTGKPDQFRGSGPAFSTAPVTREIPNSPETNASDSPGAPEHPDADALDLTQFLALPGCIALQARSPKHPRVQLSLDETGTLHLLIQHDSTTPAVADIRAALLELLEARAWVNEHRQLIALTQRQLRFDPAAIPILHLFSDDARATAALAARLGDQLKLHLLQAVQLENDWAWFNTEIN